MYQPTYFKPYELVSKELYLYLNKDSNKIFNLFDERMLKTIDGLRNLYGKAIINNWFFGGTLNERGYRKFDTETGAEFSQHKFGRAFDINFLKVKTDDIVNNIIKFPFFSEFKYITCVEKNVSWLHIDCRNHDKKNLGVKVIYP